MKKILFLAFALLTAISSSAATSAYDVYISQRNAGNTASPPVTVSPGANEFLGFDANKVLVSKAGGGGSVPGSNTQVIFNDGGVLGADAGLTYNKTTDALTVAGLLTAGTLNLGGVLLTPTGTELNFVDGVTSAIQTQMNAKQATITFGTGVETALGVNVGSAGAVVVNGGALGTPSSGTGTNITGIPAANISSGALANGMTATTQAAGSVDTKVATDAYADNAGLATILGTFASPNTAAGSVTWSTASTCVTTSAAGATRTYTLPAASSYTGKKFMLTVGAGTNHVNLQPQSGAALVLSGVLLTANYYVQAATSAVGDSVIGFSDGTNWQIFVAAGTWAGAASP